MFNSVFVQDDARNCVPTGGLPKDATVIVGHQFLRSALSFSLLSGKERPYRKLTGERKQKQHAT